MGFMRGKTLRVMGDIEVLTYASSLLQGSNIIYYFLP